MLWLIIETASASLETAGEEGGAGGNWRSMTVKKAEISGYDE